MDLTKYMSRTDDPGTSKEAAKKAVKRVPLVRNAVLLVMTEEGPGTLDQIISRFNHRAVRETDWPQASASSIRTRVSELVRCGLAEQVPDEVGRSAMGNRAAVWRVVPVQNVPADDMEGAEA